MTRYAKSGDVNIAYQVIGDGPGDLIYVPGWVSNIEVMHEDPGYSRFLRRLAAVAREGRLAPDQLAGGTFTITNGGVFGSLLSTPILNPPQSGILGMHKIQDRPVAVEGQVVIRPMMYVALSYDHRLVDGEQAVTFLVRVKELLEDPARMVLEA